MPLELLTIRLNSLVGEHVLDAVDLFVERVNDYDDHFEDANCIRFRLDGAVYTAVEDPADGYRSSMDRCFVTLDVKMKNTFPPVRVQVCVKSDTEYETNNTLVFLCLENNKVVMEVGTDNIDDYYPMFVGRFNPENMPVNKGK